MAGEAKEPQPILDACRHALRFASCTDHDDEIADLIGAAREKMRAGGISEAAAKDDSDPLVRVAVKAYVKANFGLDNPDSEKYAATFEGLVTQMKCTEKYGGAR